MARTGLRRAANGKVLRDKAMKMLRQLPYMEQALACTEILPEAEQAILENRALLQRRVAAIHRGLSILNPEERQVLLRMADETEGAVFDLCESCACEKSTVYRWRKRALDKFTLALFGRV